MSTVFYRWGAGRDESRVTFDGTHISVFDLKREIILANKMGNGRDFDIGIYDNVTGEEFKDDNHQIPRSSSLIARRLPSSIKGRGNAQNYIQGTTAADALNNEHRIENHAKDAMLAKQKGIRVQGGTYGSLAKRFDGKEDEKDKIEISTGDAEEDKRLQAFFAQSGDQWEQTQDEMSTATGRGPQGRIRPPRPNQGSGPSGSSGSTQQKFEYSMSGAKDKEPPVGYICYRCAKKGHWIEDCPQEDDPDAVERKRFSRVTGIPRSFLKTVEAAPGAGGSSAGAMLTADGGFVMAVPDVRQWQKQAAVKRRRQDNETDANGVPMDLVCPIDKVLLREATLTPCCDTTFCEECITNHLLENDWLCPACESKISSLGKLRPDELSRERVKEFKENREDGEKGEVDAVDGEDGIHREEGENGEVKKEVRKDGEMVKKEEEDEESKSESEEGAIISGPPTEIDLPKPASTVKPLFDPIKMQEMLNPQTMKKYTTQVNKMLQMPSLLPHARALLQAQLDVVKDTVNKMQMMGMMGFGPAANHNNHNNQRNNQNMHQNGGNGHGPGNGPMNNSMGNVNDIPIGQNMGMQNGNINGMNGIMNNMNGMQMGNMGMNNLNNMGGMGMNMGMMMPNMGGMMGVNNNMNGNMNMGIPNRGRGGFRGGFRGRGGGAGGGFNRGGGGGFNAGRSGPGPGMKRQADEAGMEGPMGMNKQQRMG